MEFHFCPKCATALVDHFEEGRTRRACPKAGCGFIYYGNPTPVVAAIVELEGEIVLVRAHGWPEKFFGLVTGFLEAAETPQQGALREVKEELGLDAQLVSLVGAYSFEMKNEVIIAFHVKAQGAVTLGAELSAFKRIAPARLRAWEFGTGLAVRDWLAAR